jgi:hypothetical protein
VLVKGRVGTGVTVNGFRCGGAVSVVVPGCAALEVAVFDRGWFLVVWVLVKGRVGNGVTVNDFRCGGAVSVVVPGWLCGMEVAVFGQWLV